MTSDREKIRIKTPLGTLVAYAHCEDGLRGICIDLARPGAENDAAIAFVGCDIGSYDTNLITRVWGDVRSLFPTEYIEHREIDSYFDGDKSDSAECERAYSLQACDNGEWTDNLGEYDSFEEAAEAAGKLYDKGEYKDFGVVSTSTNCRFTVLGFTLERERCQICGKPVRNFYMKKICASGGTPLYTVCPQCYGRNKFER